jgi:hypothetical protein
MSTRCYTCILQACFCGSLVLKCRLCGTATGGAVHNGGQQLLAPAVFPNVCNGSVAVHYCLALACAAGCLAKTGRKRWS